VNDASVHQLTYAGLGKRGLALLIDSLVWLIVISQVAGAIPQDVYEDNPVVVGVVFLALFSIAFNYFWFTEWKWGKTIGKAVCSIHVTAEDGSRPALGPTTVRNLLRLVDVIVIGPLLIANTQRHQRLGDRFAHTIVVRDQRARPRPSPAPQPTMSPATSGAANRGPQAAGVATEAVAVPPAPPDVGVGESGGGQHEPRDLLADRASDSNPWKRAIGIPAGGWGPTQVVLAVIAVLVLVTIEAGVVSIFDPDLDSLGATLGVQALLAATLIGVALAFATRSTSLVSALNELGVRRFARSALGVAAVTYVAYLIFAVIYNAFVHPEQEDITRDLGLDDGGGGAFVAGALIVAAAPLSEEIFFRGFIFGGLRRRLPMWAAAAIAGAVFGVLHYTGPDSIGVVPQLAVLGVLLAWLYERTGSLWPPIILHVANNGLALIVLTSS
jgi:membrane protease YdiL (CAAX protease family)/uncharacterized RDD family membrane protein YckC